jgi:hypothetical protein
MCKGILPTLWESGNTESNSTVEEDFKTLSFQSDYKQKYPRYIYFFGTKKQFKEFVSKMKSKFKK